MYKHGFFRIAVASPVVRVSDPGRNVARILEVCNTFDDPDLILLPELAVTGYTCGDLFHQPHLLQQAEKAVLELWRHLPARPLVFVGCPVRIKDSLYNCALAFQDGKLIGIVPKTYHPNYKEFYEARYFKTWDNNCPTSIRFAGGNVPFGPDLVFTDPHKNVRIFAEICEDLWMPIPPSSLAVTQAKANIIVNLSASNELVAKAEYRLDLVKNQSARCVAAYAYSSAGPNESTSDLVFGGHCIIAENGNVLAESTRVGNRLKYKETPNIMVDVDVQKLSNDRAMSNTFGQQTPLETNPYRDVGIWFPERENRPLIRYVNPNPFVPQDPNTLKARCADIFGIQTFGLMKRFEMLGTTTPLTIGVSGGLDSTLALLALVKACDEMDLPHTRILGFTMPGFGTSGRTKENALKLMGLLGITQETIPITDLSSDVMLAIKHKPFGQEFADTKSLEAALQGLPDDKPGDLVFENVQARVRTLLLMSKGFVVGTGDLSEAALGWCTYNADHMSMYNPNCSIPKTLVRFVVRYIAECEVDTFVGVDTAALKAVLMDILDTPISPELLPLKADGQHAQKTEDVLGPYELHDFFMFHFLRNQYPPDKIFFLAQNAKFSESYTPEFIKKTLNTFLQRFMRNQFKRNCVPDGPKVGSVSLSPRGDWRMPADASSSIWSVTE